MNALQKVPLCGVARVTASGSVRTMPPWRRMAGLAHDDATVDSYPTLSQQPPDAPSTAGLHLWPDRLLFEKEDGRQRLCLGGSACVRARGRSTHDGRRPARPLSSPGMVARRWPVGGASNKADASVRGGGGGPVSRLGRPRRVWSTLRVAAAGGDDDGRRQRRLGAAGRGVDTPRSLPHRLSA